MIPEQTKLQKDLNTVYALGDTPNHAERESVGLATTHGWLNRMGAVYTGEKRPPRKGEWYLSGGVVQAYRAPNDFTTAHAIAQLVRVEEVTEIKIVARVPRQ